MSLKVCMFVAALLGVATASFSQTVCRSEWRAIEPNNIPTESMLRSEKKRCYHWFSGYSKYRCSDEFLCCFSIIYTDDALNPGVDYFMWRNKSQQSKNYQLQEFQAEAKNRGLKCGVKPFSEIKSSLPISLLQTYFKKLSGDQRKQLQSNLSAYSDAIVATYERTAAAG